jgi:hypothetical protein
MSEWLIEWRTVERQGPHTPYIVCPLECMGQDGKKLLFFALAPERFTSERSEEAWDNLEPATPFCLHCAPFLLFHPLLRRLSPPLCVRAHSYSGVIGQFSRNLPRTVRASAALISTTVRRLKPVRYQQYLATPGPVKEIFMPPSD